MTKKKAKKWFIKVRASYLPNSWQGSLTYIPYLAYLIGVAVFVIKQDYGFWFSLFVIIPNWVAAVAVMTWLAKQQS